MILMQRDEKYMIDSIEEKKKRGEEAGTYI